VLLFVNRYFRYPLAPPTPGRRAVWRLRIPPSAASTGRPPAWRRTATRAMPRSCRGPSPPWSTAARSCVRDRQLGPFADACGVHHPWGRWAALPNNDTGDRNTVTGVKAL